MNRKRPNALTGIAGVHYVAAELSQRGLVALPTVRNTAAYDIIAASLDGKKHANIQVKTSSKRVSFWLMPPSKKIRTGPNDYYVLLRWLDNERRYQGFIVTGVEAKHEVRRNEKRQENSITGRTRRNVFPSLHVGGKNETKSRRWAKRWENWTL